MNKIELYLSQKLQERTEQNNFRTLSLIGDKIDFFSNDYLGIVKNKLIEQSLCTKESVHVSQLYGSTGSRLISGNSAFAEMLEEKLATFYQTESALLFNSGFDANIGVLSSIPSKQDTIIYDSLCHASLIDGIRLNLTPRKFKFKHNNLDDLVEKIKQASGNIFIVIESIYSMDGDVSPLQEIVKIAKEYEAAIIIDEAHSTGIMGEQGRGYVQSLHLEKEIFARIHTFGKAMGCHGAVVVGSNALRNYLINFARSFIYTTALPIHSLMGIDAAYDLFIQHKISNQTLVDNIAYFNHKKINLAYPSIHSTSPIQAIVIGGNEKTKEVAARLQKNGLMIKPILQPTVAKGSERVRICLHAFNTKEEIDAIFQIVEK